MSVVERNYDNDVSLPTLKTVEDANECVASFFVSFRLALDNAGIMEYHRRNPLYNRVMEAETSIREELGDLMGR